MMVAFLLFVSIFLVPVCIPKLADKNEKNNEEHDLSMDSAKNHEQKKKSSWWRTHKLLIKEPKILILFVTYFLSSVQYIYYEPIMALYLQEHWGLPLFQNNMFFMIVPAAYLVGSSTFFILYNVIQMEINNMALTVVSCIGCAISLFLCGPSSVFEDSLTIMIVGLSGLGFFVILTTITLLPLI